MGGMARNAAERVLRVAALIWCGMWMVSLATFSPSRCSRRVPSGLVRMELAQLLQESTSVCLERDATSVRGEDAASAIVASDVLQHPPSRVRRCDLMLRSWM